MSVNNKIRTITDLIILFPVHDKKSPLRLMPERALIYTCFYFFFFFGDDSIAACAAASLAIGTRNGEQET